MVSRILKVSELTQQIKILLEESFPFVWVEGELSNVTLHSSGHCYFTLKDEKAQIRAVMFRSQVRRLPFKPETGTKVVVRGRIGVYEPRGEYQIITEFMEPLGKGSLQLAFEQIKKKLAKEGLFNSARKKPLPLLPQRIGIITSPTGAAIRDILRILGHRFVNLEILLIPVRVQGVEAPGEIISALEMVNSLVPGLDVVIAGRGGGSLEDLWAFNDEGVARAVAGCPVPVVSAVGHESDFTISDLVADVRAPTPSAAAEMVVKKKEELAEYLDLLGHRITQGFAHSLKDEKSRLAMAERGLINPKKKIVDLNLRADDLSQRVAYLFNQHLQRKQKDWKHQTEKLGFISPREKIRVLKEEVERKKKDLSARLSWKMERCLKTLEKAMAQLDAVSPLGILKRGYSITRTWPEQKVVRDAGSLSLQQEVEVKFFKGEVICKVTKVNKVRKW